MTERAVKRKICPLESGCRKPSLKGIQRAKQQNEKQSSRAQRHYGCTPVFRFGQKVLLRKDYRPGTSRAALRRNFEPPRVDMAS